MPLGRSVCEAGGAYGQNYCSDKPKGRRGQDHHGSESDCSPGRQGEKGAPGGCGPPGQRHQRPGINKREIQSSAYDVLLGNAKAQEAVLHTPFQNVDILPGSMDLAAAEIEMVELPERNLRLKQAIIALKGEYDFILIDCPPSLGIITLNALTACDTILVPIQCEYYALEGLSQLIATVRQVKRLYNPRIEIEGVLLTMFDGRLNLTLQVVEEVKRFFPQKVYATAIPRNVRLSEAPSFGQPVMYFDRASKGASAYDSLAQEVLQQNGGNAAWQN